jgi:hypothetical protein
MNLKESTQSTIVICQFNLSYDQSFSFTIKPETEKCRNLHLTVSIKTERSSIISQIKSSGTHAARYEMQLISSDSGFNGLLFQLFFTLI